MNRRSMLRALGALAAAPGIAAAHHGWSSFDPGRPLYLAGRVKSVRWGNPHAEFELEIASPLALPPGLAARPVPPQTAPLDAKDILGRTVLPMRADRVWTVELAPLSRMQAWGVEPLREGEAVEVVGYTFTGERGEAVLRAEWLFRNGKTYGLRSSPAS